MKNYTYNTLHTNCSWKFHRARLCKLENLVDFSRDSGKGILQQERPQTRNPGRPHKRGSYIIKQAKEAPALIPLLYTAHKFEIRMRNVFINKVHISTWCMTLDSPSKRSLGLSMTILIPLRLFIFYFKWIIQFTIVSKDWVSNNQD